VQLNPHLSFDGHCEAAFRFYASCLNGRVVAMMTYGESPMKAQTPPERHGHILHATLHIGAHRLTGGDAPGAKHSGFHVLYSAPKADAERVFKELAEGGRVDVHMAKTFWAERFGICVDRFGVPWIISSE
jgi:PhnB protein